MGGEQYPRVDVTSNASIQHVQAVNPSDDQDIRDIKVMGGPPRAIKVTVAGNIHITDMIGKESTFPIAAGVWEPVVCTRIHATDTTATGIFVGW